MAAQEGPIVDDFFAGVKKEYEFQESHWGRAHDRNKTAADWFWLVGYLAGKALHAALIGDAYKAKHHTISAAAALGHWHASIGHARDPDKPSDVERMLAAKMGGAS